MCKSMVQILSRIILLRDLTGIIRVDQLQMDHVGLLVFFVVILYILYEVTSAYKSYKRNIKKAEDAKLPHVAQFLPHTSLLFMFIPRFIKKNFYTRNFSNTQILEVFEKLQSPIFGFVSYRGTEIVVK